MFSVYQHWDPLRVCVVGRTYPPEFYSWINVPHVRTLFERIAIETEEDYQKVIAKLTEFGVTVIRPELPDFADCFVNNRYLPPPMTPRDVMIMVGKIFYKGYQINDELFYNSVKSSEWLEFSKYREFSNLPQHIQDECNNLHHYSKFKRFYSSYDKIYEYIASQGNDVVHNNPKISQAPGAYITRMGKDLYFGTENYAQDQVQYKALIDKEFTSTRNHIVNTGGHSDGTYCPVAPGLIISLHDVPTYQETFPGWEVVYLPGQSWGKVKDFLHLKKLNRGKWWIPGFEHDLDVINTVETWLSKWVGYVEETVFDVNMLIIDPKNVMVFNYNEKVFNALERYGITPHIVPFRHRYFWDGGIHCITADLHREGVLQDYFPERS